MPEAKVGVIGGSGLYDMPGLTDVTLIDVVTPFGSPSDSITLGSLSDVRVAFIPRHGRGHHISPSELPARANIWALKSLGVTHVVSVSAVGSLREEMAPRHIVIPDQILDRTKGVRPATFFGDGVVVHIAFGQPYCPELRQIMYESALDVGAPAHDGGTMVVMEGPQFSTKAESLFHQQVGGDLIGMTALPEAKLAREAEICYCTLALVTDYDCWHESEEAVTVNMVVANLMASVDYAKRALAVAVPRIAQAARKCDCGYALENAIITSPDVIPTERRRSLSLLLDKYS